MTSKLSVCLFAAALGAAALLPSGASAAELATPRAAFVLSLRDATTERDRTEPPRHAVATAVAVSPDGAFVAAGGDDHCVRLWDTLSGEEIARLEGHEDWVRGLQVSPDGERLASVANDATLRFWSPKTGQPTTEPLRLGRGPLSAVAFRPQEEQVLTVGFRTPLQVFDLGNAGVSNEYACACEDTRSIAVSPNGRWAAAAGRNGRLRVWDLHAGRALPDVPAETQRIHSVVFSPTGDIIATGGDSRRVRFWNPADGELLAELPTDTTKIRSLLFLSSEQLAVGGVDNTLSVWSISSRLPTHRLIGHTGTVESLACDASGRVLASASYDTTVRVWRLGRPGVHEAASANGDDANGDATENGVELR